MTANLIPGVESKYITRAIVDNYHRCKQNRKLRIAVKAKARNQNEIDEGDYALFHRENNVSWLGPGFLITVNSGTVHIEFDGRIYSSNIRSFKKVSQRLETICNSNEYKHARSLQENE